MQTVKINPGLAAAVGDAQRQAGKAFVEVVELAARRRLEALHSGDGERTGWHDQWLFVSGSVPESAARFR